MKSRDGKSQRREEKKKEDRKRASLRRKKIQVRDKVGKSRNTVFFQWFVAPEGRKVGSLKRRVRSQLGRWEMKNCTPLWREAHFEVNMYKAHHARTTVKVHAVVARSTFASEKAKSTSRSEHFLKLRCRKSARRSGAKHISKSTCTKHTMFGHVRTTFGSWDVKKVHAVVARSTFRSQNVKSTRGSDHFWTFRCRFAWQAQGIVHLVTSEQNVRVLWHFQLQPPLHHTTLQYATLQLQLHLHYIHSTTLHYTPLHPTTLLH